MPAAKKAEAFRLDSDKALAGILAVLAANREDRLNDRAEPRRTEVVLADAGLDYGEIATLTGKNYEAVKAAVRRSREPAKKKR
jgi:DNA-directed RNA polymerase specialized sigma24 family protein